MDMLATIARRIRRGFAGIPSPLTFGAVDYWRFWDGDSVSGLSDDDDIVTATNLVSGRPALEGVTAGKRPVWQSEILGGRDAAYFDGTKCLRTAADITLGPFTVFAVAQATRQSTLALLYELGTNGASTPGFYLNMATTGMMVHKAAGGQSGYNTTTIWWSKVTPHATIQKSDGTHAGHRFRIAGEERTLSSLGGYATDPGTGTTTKKLYIGARAGSSLFINGWVSEIAVFDRPLSDAECESLENYAAANYDLGDK